jgi:hypothetical protein
MKFFLLFLLFLLDVGWPKSLQIWIRNTVDVPQFRLPMNMSVSALLLPETPVILGNVLGVLLLAMSGLQGPLLVLRPNSQSPLQLCLKIFISTDPRNLLRISTVQLLYTVKDEKWKT